MGTFIFSSLAVLSQQWCQSAPECAQTSVPLVLSLARTHIATFAAGGPRRLSAIMTSTARRSSSFGAGARRAGACTSKCLCALLGIFAAVLGVPRAEAASVDVQRALVSQSAPTCTVQLDAVSANGNESVTGKLKMHFPTDSSADEDSYTIVFFETPDRDAMRVPDDYLVGDNFDEVMGDVPPNVALTGATIVEGGDVQAVNMIFIMVSGAAEASESDDSSDASPSVIEYAFTQSPAHQSASIFPPGNLTSDATTILGCGLLIDSTSCWSCGLPGSTSYP